jgi:hypothetical protein
VRDSYLSRRQLEYLENEDQLKHVYQYFLQGAATYPLTYPYDWTRDRDLLPEHLDACRTRRHPLALRSAGNWGAGVVLVGEKFTEVTERDTLYQWPFGSFSGQGCSQWFAEQLDAAGVTEHRLLWVNADQDLSLIEHQDKKQFVALGAAAEANLEALGVPFSRVDHPQSWKRFHYHERYPLVDILPQEDV